MREMTEKEKARAKELTFHRFPDDKKPNVLMLLHLVHDQIHRIWEDEMCQEERDFHVGLLCEVMKHILDMELRSSDDGQTEQ